MNRHTSITRGIWAVAGMLFLSSLLTVAARAQSNYRATGEFASGSGATINGVSALSGMTVFDGNRLKTGGRGAAIVNLGKVGRLELGEETDLTLRFSRNKLGGDLAGGRTVLSAPVGVAVAVSTPKGLVTTDGREAATLTIEIKGKIARVIAHRGGARVVSNGQVTNVEEGEEIATTPRSDGWKRKSLVAAGVAGASGAATAAQIAGQVAKPAAATASQTTSTLTSLFNAGVNYSIIQLTRRDRDPEQFFSTTITCRDHDNTFCRRRSGVTP